MILDAVNKVCFYFCERKKKIQDVETNLGFESLVIESHYFKQNTEKKITRNSKTKQKNCSLVFKNLMIYIQRQLQLYCLTIKYYLSHLFLVLRIYLLA